MDHQETRTTGFINPAEPAWLQVIRRITRTEGGGRRLLAGL